MKMGKIVDGKLEVGVDVKYCSECPRGVCSECAIKKKLLDILKWPECNTCSKRVGNKCGFVPELGGNVRYNCPLYEKDEKSVSGYGITGG